MPTNSNWGTVAFDVTADGSRIGGRIYRSDSGGNSVAGLWTEETGMMLPLQKLLTNQYGLGEVLEGWQLTGVYDITDDGRFMTGTAINPAGIPEGFLVDMGVTLAADLTGNGFVDFEDLTVLLANWNKQVGAAAGNLVNPTTTPVNFEDLTVLLADWTGPGPAASPEGALGAEAVPEPSTLALALVAALVGMSAVRRRRRVLD
ncbi:MAG: PEP-CTERM sorting domain-containing protein [Planctomycetes bacterium]|nr:PEP-CTERM sorting domain-containing protein [Planctomycetota bacterium]